MTDSMVARPIAITVNVLKVAAPHIIQHHALMAGPRQFVAYDLINQTLLKSLRDFQQHTGSSSQVSVDTRA